MDSQDQNHDHDPDFTFVTRSGVRIPCAPVMANFIAAVQSSVRLPDPPTYLTIPTLAGNREEHPLDESIVYGIDDVPMHEGAPLIFPHLGRRELRVLSADARDALTRYEARKVEIEAAWRAEPEMFKEELEQLARWNEYRAAYEAAQAEQYAKTMKWLIVKGALLDAPDDGWEALQREAGIEVPEDRHERKVHYYQTELLNGDEILEFVTFIIDLGTRKRRITEEAIRFAEETFRDPARREPAPENGGRTSQRHRDAQGKVELRSIVS